MLVLLSWTCLVLVLCNALVRADSANDPHMKSIPLRTHSLALPYLDSDMQSRWWEFGGDTVVRTDKYVRLTGEYPSRTGWIFSRVPLTATNWEIEAEFKIHGAATLYGDGMALWLTKQRGQQGPVFGMADKFEGLGVFIDTYKNNRPGTVFPYISVMLGDGQTSYDKDNDGKSNEIAGCSVRGIRNQNFPTKLRLRYYQDRTLSLELQYQKEDQWTECFSIPAPKMPGVTYLGFSAETGELSDNHDLISVSTKNLYATSKGGTNEGARGAGSKKSRKRSGGGWGWFFFKFLMFGLVLAGGYVGFTMYRTSSRRSRF